ncbi:MAG TPA: MliC family protein [Bryobacteraceae bacterium]|jgi:membrane-bound inhibitor of C-type lysozyme
MKYFVKLIVIGVAVACCSTTSDATDLTIKLTGSDAISRNIETFQCDVQGPQLGLPAGPFPVEYLNGAGNSLAVLPIQGQSLIFVNVVSGSGARYASGRYIWWDAGSRGVHLYSDSLEGKKETSCQTIKGSQPPAERGK